MITNRTKHNAVIRTTRVGSIAAWDDLLATWDNYGSSVLLWLASISVWQLSFPWQSSVSTTDIPVFYWDNGFHIANRQKGTEHARQWYSTLSTWATSLFTWKDTNAPTNLPKHDA